MRHMSQDPQGSRLRVESIIQLAGTLRMLRERMATAPLRRIEGTTRSSRRSGSCQVVDRVHVQDSQAIRPVSAPLAQSSPPGMMEPDDYALADTAKRGRLRTRIAAHSMATIGPEIIGGGGG
jgi:hypothetical protein